MNRLPDPATPETLMTGYVAQLDILISRLSDNAETLRLTAARAIGEQPQESTNKVETTCGPAITMVLEDKLNTCFRILDSIEASAGQLQNFV